MRTNPQLDYLFVFGLFTAPLSLSGSDGWVVKNLGKSTSIFKEQYKVTLYGKEICTVVAYPHSSILPPNSGMIKFDNWLLYSPMCGSLIESAFSALSFEFKRVSRVDICCDFTAFENLLHPQDFIRGVFSLKYKKEFRGKFKAIGTISDAVEYDYLRFGSNSSEICSYLYNKSKELREVKAKEWIYDLWHKSGWNGVSDVYRLEFSLKLQSSMCLDSDSAEILNFTLSDLLLPDFRSKMFESLIARYFRFSFVQMVVSNRKPKVEKKHLLLFSPFHSDNFLFAHRPVLEGSRKYKTLIKTLYNLHSEMKDNERIRELLNPEMCETLAKELGLGHWLSLEKGKLSPKV